MLSRLDAFHRDLAQNSDGATAIVTGLVLTGLVGFAGLGTEVGLWYETHRTMQAAADSSALGAAVALGVSGPAAMATEAKATLAKYGYFDDVDGVTVTINHPPTAGAYNGVANAVEVIVQQPQNALFSALFLGTSPTINGRAVALQGAAANGCVLALDAGAKAATFGNGTTNVNLTGCQLDVNSNSNAALTLVGGAEITADSANIVGGVSGISGLTTVNGVRTGAAPVADPYANVALPSYQGCDHNNYSPKNGAVLSPGTYCGGMKINAGVDVVLNPGVYVLDQGSLSVAGNATVTGEGVTIVMTSSTGSNPATADIHGGATLDINAPTTGATAGIAFFQDRTGTPGTVNDFSGGTTQNISGALYFPTETITFAGGTNTGNNSTCIQLIADEIDFKGNANLAVNCTGKGVKAIGGSTAKLVE